MDKGFYSRIVQMLFYIVPCKTVTLAHQSTGSSLGHFRHINMHSTPLGKIFVQFTTMFDEYKRRMERDEPNDFSKVEVNIQNGMVA